MRFIDVFFTYLLKKNKKLRFSYIVLKNGIKAMQQILTYTVSTLFQLQIPPITIVKSIKSIIFYFFYMSDFRNTFQITMLQYSPSGFLLVLGQESEH